MKVKEVTNPEEQLGLLRVIIDNTWSAIQQQANAQARQKATQSPTRSKVKAVKSPKQPIHTPKQQPLLKPKATQPVKTHPAIKGGLNKTVYRQHQPNQGASKIPSNNSIAQTNTSLSNLEKDETLKLPRGAIPKSL